MEQFIDLLKRIIKEGKEKKDRTSTGTISIFGHQSEYDLSKGLPLLTAKHTYTRGIIIELLWFLGNHMKDERYANLPMTNIKYLVDNNVNIWNEWAHKGMLKYQKESHAKISAEYPNQTFTQLPPMPLDEFREKIKNEKGFAEKWGDLGAVYGQQWKMWQFTEFVRKDNKGVEARTGHCDQISWALHMLKTKPEDRGIIISAWNVGELDHMALRPCHTMFQFYTEELTQQERNLHIIAQEARGEFRVLWSDEELNTLNVPKYKLSLQLYQRSADTFLGVPFNIASYSILLHMFAQLSNMVPGKFVHTFGDAHIYSNHKTQVNELLKKISPELRDNPEPLDFFENKELLDKVGNDWPALPQLWLNPEVNNMEDFTPADIEIKNYKPLSKIEAPIAI
jgi:thymidylate synthase